MKLNFQQANFVLYGIGGGVWAFVALAPPPPPPPL